MNAKIEIKTMQEMQVACICSTGHQNLEAAYQNLIRWATALGILSEQTKMLTIYHDSFKVTDPEKVHTDACILLKEPIKVSDEVSLASIPGGRCIVGSFEIILQDFEKSWTGLFVWMNEKGYKKANRNVFELYYNDFNTHPQKKVLVDLCIPVE